MDNKSNQKTGSKGPKIFIVAGLSLFVLLLVTLCAYLGVKVFLDSIETLEPGDTANASVAKTDSSQSLGMGTALEQGDTIFVDGDVVNILLVGVGGQAEEEESPQETKAIILCSVNVKEKCITLTSFMHNLWVYIPSLNSQELSMPYKLGGFPLLNNTLEYNFGTYADYNISIDFDGFMRTIDIIGGVEITLTDAEAKYLNQRGNWGIEENRNWVLKEGSNRLTGSQTLAYTRISHIGTEFATATRQHTVLKSLIAKLGTYGTADLFDLSREILPLISTNMSDNQIFDLVLDMLPIVQELDIQTQHIPLNGQYRYTKKGGSEVLVMSKEQLEVNRRLLKETVGDCKSSTVG